MPAYKTPKHFPGSERLGSLGQAMLERFFPADELPTPAMAGGGPPFKVPPMPKGDELYYSVLNQIGRMRYAQDPVKRAELFGEFGDDSAKAVEARMFEKPFLAKEIMGGPGKPSQPMSRFDYRHPHTLNETPSTPETESMLQDLLRFLAD